VERFFEIGGKSKGRKQLRDIDDSYIVSDNVEIGFKKKIPLWLFLFLYDFDLSRQANISICLRNPEQCIKCNQF
jgi:hypothetical protein